MLCDARILHREPRGRELVDRLPRFCHRAPRRRHHGHMLPLGPPVLILADARRLGEGQGARFRVVLDGVECDAFAVRYRGRVHAYLNTCRHQSLPLDFGDAHFFDDAYDALVCCHHGARYRPENGECFEGPCRGGWLTPLEIEEREGGLFCTGARTRRPGNIQ